MSLASILMGWLLLCLTPIFLMFLLQALFKFLNNEVKNAEKPTTGHYKKCFRVETTPIKTFEIIMQFATKNEYRIDTFDEKEKFILLFEKMTLFSAGSRYPIYIYENEGTTVIDVSVASKLGNASKGPINNKLLVRRLDRMVTQIKDCFCALKTGE